MDQQQHLPKTANRKRSATPLAVEVASAPQSPALIKIPLVTTPGWHDLAEEAYHADPCPAPSLSSHVAMTIIGKSLLHAWRGHPKSPLFEASVMGAAADRGSAAHALLFGGKAIEAIVADDFRTAAARDARDKARAAGRIPMLSKDIEGLTAMIEPARQRFLDLHGGAFLCEQSAVWRGQDPEAGWRRARIDTVSTSRALIVDYKTTEGAVDALSCERRVADMGLQIQAAAYVDAVEALHPELMGRVKFIFQWQEQKAPYALSPPIEMSEAFLSLGRAQWKAACHLWDKALRHNAFPGYSYYPYLACPPPWELSRWEERQLTDANLAEMVS
ncbi:MAG: PD-(D/E)XK nuclease family protein [Hyphomonadaceae bacterium]